MTGYDEWSHQWTGTLLEWLDKFIPDTLMYEIASNAYRELPQKLYDQFRGFYDSESVEEAIRQLQEAKK